MKKRIDENINDINENTVKKHQIISYTILAITGLIFFIFVNLGMKVNESYYLGNVLIIPGLFLFFKANKHYKTLQRVMYLKEQWGKSQKQNKKKKASTLYNHLSNKGNEGFLDDQTWHDLNMDNIFYKLNRTHSTPGREVLYKMLRKPLFDADKLNARAKQINKFQENESLRIRTQLILMNLGIDSSFNATDFLWEEVPKPSKFRYIFLLMSILAIAAIGQIFFTGIKGAILILPVYLINLFVHNYMSRRYSHKIPTISYINAIINSGIDMSKIKSDELVEHVDILKECTNKTKKILKKTIFLKKQLYNDITDIMYEYFKIFFLLEVNSFNAAISDINKNINEIRNIYLTLGEIDALQSIASYRTDIENYCEPEFNDNKVLHIEEGVNPLIEKPVANSIDINQKGILITGSNMAGKSTFLRTVGVNVVFAQTICTCLASKYRGKLYNILTSISQTDDLTKGKSFYFTESERIRRMIELSNREYPTLCIVDEMLSGTNSMERVNASEEILRYMIKRNVLVIVATHDLDLAKRLYNDYKCYYFNDNVTKEGLDFDYSIKEGIAVTSNAIKLLDYLGYPEEIVAKAKEKVAHNMERFGS
ncbi:MutS family DNA mismatch repair protein [Sporosalibacterium faouarense]|uniref:MutS family DNA mismatch repair protein n=1 Tax=Sporosalibacterium faouarense TaxID=516123 RepID=UPI00141CEC12|nr:MutS family DNA mismatch repair protein [Sporosalibacterium faouarense]MTI46521.1 MutS family DNA mismatch repair protein [Bacillota bacterium]